MSESNSKSLKIFFHAVDGIGHLNACAGLGQALAARGHRIYFLLNEGFAGQFNSKFGFDEIVLKISKPPNDAKSDPETIPINPIQQMAEQIISMGVLGPKSPLEKMKDSLKSNDNSFFDQLLATGIDFNPQIEEAINREKPDLFILDHFVAPPAVQRFPFPWVYLCSTNPLALFKYEDSEGKLPFFGSGISTESDPSTWRELETLWLEHGQPKYAQLQQDLNSAFNFVPQVEVQNRNSMILQSPYLNIYGFPEELDYRDLVPIPRSVVGVDAFFRIEVSDKNTFDVPKELNVQPGDKLIYVSLGSMGSIDVELMKRITSVLAKTPYKYIVSKGQRGDEYELPDNCWGENFLPQTEILPIVDLVITHGGNNTITETFSFGKPMIVMPLFGDQYDNAQRVHEKKYGIRVEPYSFTEQELLNAISQLLHDTELHQRLQVAKERMAKSNSIQRACERIEQIVTKF